MVTARTPLWLKIAHIVYSSGSCCSAGDAGKKSVYRS